MRPFGCTPGFREQRCERLMLAARLAWHSLPFPISPCALAACHLPQFSTPSLQHPRAAKRIREEKKTRGGDLFFSSLLTLPRWHHLSCLQMLADLTPPPPQDSSLFFFFKSLFHFIIAVRGCVFPWRPWPCSAPAECRKRNLGCPAHSTILIPCVDLPTQNFSRC